jgi:hypothetical protein
VACPQRIPRGCKIVDSKAGNETPCYGESLSRDGISDNIAISIYVNGTNVKGGAGADINGGDEDRII